MEVILPAAVAVFFERKFVAVVPRFGQDEDVRRTEVRLGLELRWL